MGRKKGPRPLDDVAGGAEIIPLPAYIPQTTGARLATVANLELTVAERQRLREQLRELERRQFESLRLYEPLPVQQAFHASRSRQRLVVGCLAAETPIYDPVECVTREVGSITGNFHVHAWDEAAGRAVPAPARTPFVKGCDDLYEVTLSNGESFRATLDHRVLTEFGWLSVRAVSERDRDASRSGPRSDVSSGRLRTSPPSLGLMTSVVSVEFVRRDVYYDFEVPFYHNYLAGSIVHHNSNRAGKTMCTCAELAWALSGTHPDPGKFPLENGRALVVGRSLEKIGEVVYRKLCRAGAFQIVRDPVSGLWRSRRPKGDEGLKVKPAPPLLPPRLIADIVWESRKAMIPKKLIMRNGWECSFYSGESNPLSIEGVDVDIGMFDEEIVHQQWFPEMVARLIDRRGYFWWGATPHVGTQQLYELHERAGAYADHARETGDTKTPPVQSFFLSLWENPHLDEEAKKEFAESLDDENRKMRVEGEFAITGTRIYEPHFFPRGVHGVDPFPVPATWCRFAAIDPGFQVGAVLFCAIPPLHYDGMPDIDPALYGDFVYFYDEVYERDCDAKKVAKAFREHCGDQEFYAYLIDHHGGMRTDIGSGKTPEDQYRDAFKAERVKLPAVGSLFVYGSDDVNGRILKVKDMLRVRTDGTAKLRFLKGAVPNTERELKKYHWQVTAGVITDKPVKRNDHQCDNIGYLCMYNRLTYHKPRISTVKAEDGYTVWKKLKEKEQRRLRRQGKQLPGVTLA